MKKFEYGGVSGFSDTTLDEFILIEDADYHKSYISKKVYEHREEGLNFNYKYVLHGTFYEDYEAREVFGYEKEYGYPPLTIDIYMVPVLESIPDESITDIMYSYGWEDEWKNFEKEFIEYIIVEAGYGMPMILERDNLIEYEDMNETFLSAAKAVDAVDGLFDFYMDKVVNGIGTTNWDLLKERLGIIDNAFSISLNRTIKMLKESKEV